MSTWGSGRLEFVLVGERDPLFVSLVLIVYYPKEPKQNEGIPLLPPATDQRHGSPSRTCWEPPIRTILLALPRKGSNISWLTTSPAK